ncbi:hypothetical protein [Hyphomicrobium methylovorum]|uniref:hypothetical protein n=1 Tax=Hyphomicrobium methylovorum TaxID=84 RepID=UPI0015E77F5B|nr:hypothetical protein [Hyphomicrobium methylovorum]
MLRTGIFIVAITATAAVSSARADTIFDVEHARANARAGLVSEYDAEMLQRWGALSGTYPPTRFSRPHTYRSYDRKRHWRRAR